MLTYAIGFVQDVQLSCFAIILVSMALHDRTNRSLRWLAFGYLAAFAGAILDLGSPWLPHWLSMGVVMEAPLVGYACFYASVSIFTRRGARLTWICILLIAGALPFFLLWSVTDQMNRSATLQDAALGIETALTAMLLLVPTDPETRWPRRTMAAFFAVYACIEVARVTVFLITGKMPAHAAPSVEVASGIVYVVSCSVLPLAFIWLMNTRLLTHLSRQSMLDPLTELLNRRGLQAAAEVELARYTRSGQDFAVVVLDLDYFKQVNDRFGHAAGDAVLCEVSVFLCGTVRETDVVARIGGEEFVLLLPGLGSRDALAAIERLRLALADHSFELGDSIARITASFGITVSAARTQLTWDLLQHEADVALYAAKRAGRNISRLYEESLDTESPSLP